MPFPRHTTAALKNKQDQLPDLSTSIATRACEHTTRSTPMSEFSKKIKQRKGTNQTCEQHDSCSTKSSAFTIHATIAKGANRTVRQGARSKDMFVLACQQQNKNYTYVKKKQLELLDDEIIFKQLGTVDGVVPLSSGEVHIMCDKWEVAANLECLVPNNYRPK